MAKYIKKPVIIEAIQLKRDNYDEICKFVNNTLDKAFELRLGRDGIPVNTMIGVTIKTLEGDMLANFGDFIIKGVRGEFYPCKPDVFEKTYELI